jgi:HD superfamily phosphodiesterase
MFNFVLLATQKYNIDESHGLSHSMAVLRTTSDLFEKEVENYPILKQHETIIYVAATLHDMCDKKYMNQADGIKEIDAFLNQDLSPIDINMVKLIISAMSYSYVKENGFPVMGPYKYAYHIVREADLLCAYDFDRCMIYNMHKKSGNVEEAFQEASALFQRRVLRHNDDELFTFKSSREQSLVLESRALAQIDTWKRLIKSPALK